MFSKDELESILVLISSVQLRATDPGFDENSKILIQLRDKCKAGINEFNDANPLKVGETAIQTSERGDNC